MKIRTTAFVLAGVAALGLSIPIFAQDQTMPMMGMGQGMMDQDMGGGMGGMMMGQRGNMTAHIDGRIAFIKAELGITEAQKPAWDEFEKAMRAHFSQMQTMRQSMMSKMKGMMQGEDQKPMPAPEMLSTRISMMESHLAEMKTMQAAVEKLYAALDAKQKEKADQLVMGMGRMM